MLLLRSVDLLVYVLLVGVLHQHSCSVDLLCSAIVTWLVAHQKYIWVSQQAFDETLSNQTEEVQKEI